MLLTLLDFLFPPREDERLLRSMNRDAFLALLDPRKAETTEAVGLLPFREPLVAAAVHEAKYHASRRATAFLGEALAEYLRDLDTFGDARAVVVPVPLGKERRRERGYNQVEEVAKEALTRLDDSARFSYDPSLLQRTRETRSQVSLSRAERAKNMRGAFRVPQDAAHPLDAAYLYIVIDDVVTTGATLAAAALALRAAGATYILALAAAYA